MHPAILRHINRLVCGESIEGGFAGFNRLIQARMPEGGFSRAISIGCGVGAKEIILLSQNIVQRFDLFEISETRLDQAKKLARRYNVLDRIDFHCADAFDEDIDEVFDLVHWNSFLHHMFDVQRAVSWSRRSLRDGGCFAMDDFVGPSRFQWTDFELEMAHKVRAMLPERLLISPDNLLDQIDRRVQRPDIEKFMEVDPSEAADSSNILKSVKEIFPRSVIIPTGGIIYHLALNDILANLDDEFDSVLLQSLLLLDETLAKMGHTQYAVAIATKD